MSYSSKNIIKGNQQQVIGANKTKQVISEIAHIADPLNIIFDIAVSAVTAADDIDIVAQGQSGDGAWADLKSATVSVDGTVVLKMTQADSNDAIHLPLREKIRLVATTGAGDTVTVNSIYVSKAL